jgi:hypothetical protein
MKRVLQHVCYWVDPTFLYPSGNDKSLQTWNWTKKIESVVMTAPLAPGGRRPWRTETDSVPEDTRVLSTSWQQSEQFLQEIWDYIQEESSFRDLSQSPLVNNS